jgi:hypothetical protein
MVVFGGRRDSGYLNDVTALSLGDVPTWTSLTPAGTPPSVRSGHSAIYDPVRDRMVVYGGWGNAAHRDDVWALSLGDSLAWTLLTPTGTLPDARFGHSAIYDPVRDRMVVFGGSSDNGVWALSLGDSLAWTLLAATGTPPIARSGHSAIYDPVRDRMVVFGGDAGGAYGLLNDAWALSLAGTPAWAPLTPTNAPAPRQAHSAIYDPVHDRMVVFGGALPSSALNDVWALSLAGPPAWTAITPASTPPVVRSGHTAIYDPMGERMLVFGGAGYTYLNDAWALSLTGEPDWTAMTATRPPPTSRSGATAIYDPPRDRMVVFGGSYLNDVWELSLAGTPVWTELTPAGTPPVGRVRHTAIYDPVRDRMVVFGGAAVGSYLNDVWTLSLAGTPVWSALTPTGTPPVGRSGHSAIYDPLRDRMVVFGGQCNVNCILGDVWALSLGSRPAWTALAPTNPLPSGRISHTAIYDPLHDRMVMFGGTWGSPAHYENSVWTLSLGGTPAWTLLTPAGTPPAGRCYHTAMYDTLRGRMVVFGGWNGSVAPYAFNDTWALSLADAAVWTALAPTGVLPSPRFDHTAIYDPVRDRMVVYAGHNSLLDDTWALAWGAPVGVGIEKSEPLAGFLRPPAPNPTRSSTTVSYSIAQPGRVQLSVYDVAGRLVCQLVDGERTAGTGAVTWAGTNDAGSQVGGGVYFVRLTGPGIHEARKVILRR